MKTLTFLLLLGMFPVLPALAQAPAFDDHFTGTTMRVDLYHTGTKTEEVFAVDRIMEGGEWAGPRKTLIDPHEFGEYRVRVEDPETGRLLFSSGHSAIFNEWQTTDEAGKGVRKTIHETVLIPFPRKTVKIAIFRRDRKMQLNEVFNVVVNPGDPTRVDRARRPNPYKVGVLMNNGSPAEKVDILILGDGYAKKDMEQFRRDAKRFNDVLFGTEPFAKRKKDFNVRYLEVESGESGIDVPDKNQWRNNALGAMYNTFGSARYVLTEENRALRDIAGAVPYDALCILVNGTRYGGGGIYNLYATTYTGEERKDQEWQMEYVYVHEFGHSFAGLGDEYYTSSTGYNDFYLPGVEPWEPNITALNDTAKLKWAWAVTPGTPLPTPWDKAAYDSLEAIRGKLDRLAPDYYEKRAPLYRAAMDLLKNSPAKGTVGAFEGAGYASKGLFRPAVDCRMFSLSLGDFDPVCSRAIEQVIDRFVR